MLPKQLHISDLLDIYGGLLTQKQQLLLDYYYNDDLALAEIAENEGITRQAVRDTLKRASAQLEEFESKLCVLKKQKEVLQTADEIISLCKSGECDKAIAAATKLKEGEAFGI